MLWVVHHWLIPVIGFAAWFGMLWAMLIYWFVKGRPIYPWQNGSIAFISDIGATPIQPLFIAGSSVMGVCFILSVASDRLLRHQSRLPRNMRRTERVLSYCAIAGATIGAIGIILVSCFNTNHFPKWHDGFLLIFILGVALSAIFTTIELRYLDTHHENHALVHRYLKASYIFKIVIVSLDIALAIAFAATLFSGHGDHNASAVLEWLVSFLFTFYLLSFAVDLWPAAAAHKGDFAVENGYSVEGFPINHNHGDTSTAASTNNSHPHHPQTVEVGRGGGATIIGTGAQAREMEQRQPEGAIGGGGHFAMRHVDDDGRPQRPL